MSFNKIILVLGFLIQSINAETIVLSWTDNSPNEEGFVIERKGVLDPEEPYVAIAQVGKNITTYIDDRVFVNVDYQYRVYAFNGEGDSGPSNTVDSMVPHSILITPAPEVPPPPPVPTLLQTIFSDGSVMTETPIQ